MLGRLGKIGEIRTMLPQLEERGRFALAKEIMGGVDRFNFSGVPDSTVDDIWLSLKAALTMRPDEGPQD